MKMILASSSPRRRDLLGMLGIDFEVIPADIDESQRKQELPVDLVERLATEKSEKIARQHPKALVLGADTIVVHNQRVLGKPSDSNQAFQMLKDLSASKHQVCTAYCLKCLNNNIKISKTSITDVEFNLITDDEIKNYIKTTEPFGKAGSYALQGIAGKFIKRIDGSHNSVIGLDIAELYLDLRKIGFI